MAVFIHFRCENSALKIDHAFLTPHSTDNMPRAPHTKPKPTFCSKKKRSGEFGLTL